MPMKRPGKLDLPAVTPLSPEDEIAHCDECVHMAERDEMATMEDPNEHPKPPSSKDEPVTDANGNLDAIEPLGLDDAILKFRL